MPRRDAGKQTQHLTLLSRKASKESPNELYNIIHNSPDFSDSLQICKNVCVPLELYFNVQRAFREPKHAPF